MDFAFYRNFITVAETGNLSAAAKRLGIVQPALSAQMKAIERNYGVQLFKMQRGKRHIELTEAGETFCSRRVSCAIRKMISVCVCRPSAGVPQVRCASACHMCAPTTSCAAILFPLPRKIPVSVISFTMLR